MPGEKILSNDEFIQKYTEMKRKEIVDENEKLQTRNERETAEFKAERSKVMNEEINEVSESNEAKNRAIEVQLRTQRLNAITSAQAQKFQEFFADFNKYLEYQVTDDDAMQLFTPYLEFRNKLDAEVLGPHVDQILSKSSKIAQYVEKIGAQNVFFLEVVDLQKHFKLFLRNWHKNELSQSTLLSFQQYLHEIHSSNKFPEHIQLTLESIIDSVASVSQLETLPTKKEFYEMFQQKKQEFQQQINQEYSPPSIYLDDKKPLKENVTSSNPMSILNPIISLLPISFLERFFPSTVDHVQVFQNAENELLKENLEGSINELRKLRGTIADASKSLIHIGEELAHINQVGSFIDSNFTKLNNDFIYLSKEY